MTMKTPEMEVVRFSESDVIVASSIPQPYEHRYVTIANLGTGTVGDATWTYTNGSTVVDSIGTYQSMAHNGTLNRNVVYKSKSGESTTLGAIVDNVDADGSFTLFNGFYETFDEGLSWVHREQ